ncbi:MAG TPA: TonB-dependent receptor plug domain-containing protein, partial [Bacteroidota bacterium]|nr:TonB-dependent receptor plug domain-containing protein [Bacteroidota bacterium]
MNARALFLAFAVVCRFTAHAGGDAPPDSLKPRYTLSEIVVTATRSGARQATVPAATTLIPRQTIDAMPGSLISDILDGVPALAIRTYGGGGAVETVSLRGMAPEHTLVLVDGERWNSFQNGLTDFGLLSSTVVDRVEVVRGGYSSMYGADAIGGVINILTRPAEDKLSASVSSSLGTNTYSAGELSLGAGTESFGIRGLIRREQGRGDYAFKFSDGRTETELNRSGDDFSLLSSELRADFRPGSTLRTSATVSHIDADRGSPGAVTDVASTGSARLADRLSTLRGGLEWDASGEVTLRLNGSMQYSVEHYTDPHTLINGSTVNSLYDNHAFILTPDARFSFSPAFSGVAGVEFARATLESTDTQDALRIQRSAFISTEHTIALPWEVPFEAILYPSIRYDAFSDVR